MSRYQYKYNPHTLRYERVEPGLLRKVLGSGVFHFAIGAMAGLLGLLYASNLFGPSSKVRELQREKKLLEQQYVAMNEHLEQMDQTLAMIQSRDDKIYRTILQTEPVPENVRQAGVGGVDRYKHLKGYDHSKLVVRTNQKLDQLSKQLKVQSRSFEKVMDLARDRKDLLASIPAIRPVPDDKVERLASGFGMRIHPIYKTMKMHSGVDFTSDIGTKVHATGSGVIEKIERKKKGYGMNVTIDHGHGYKTLYAHLHKFRVKVGDKVKRGEVIGEVGNTGTSTGPHLHYEVIKDDKKVDPINYFFNELSPEEYERVAEIAAHTRTSL